MEEGGNWGKSCELSISCETLMKLRITGVGMLIEDIEPENNPIDLRPFVVLALAWQRRLVACFLPPPVTIFPQD